MWQENVFFLGVDLPLRRGARARRKLLSAIISQKTQQDVTILSNRAKIKLLWVSPCAGLMHVSLVPMIDNSYFVTKKADSTADWPVSMVAQRSMYKIQARTKPPTTSIAEKDTMAAKVKLGTRNWKDRSAICLYSRFKTSAVYKREGRAWP